jgi:hypothetical protein
MIIRLTVRDPALRAEHDVEVTAEPDTTIQSVLRALPVPVDGRPCYAGTGGDGGPLMSGPSTSVFLWPSGLLAAAERLRQHPGQTRSCRWKQWL